MAFPARAFPSFDFFLLLEDVILPRLSLPWSLLRIFSPPAGSSPPTRRLRAFRPVGFCPIARKLTVTFRIFSRVPVLRGVRFILLCAFLMGPTALSTFFMPFALHLRDTRDPLFRL